MIEALKLAGPIALKAASGTSKTKPEAAIESDAFSKLLSSVNNEKNNESEQEATALIADIEAAIAELEQLPPQELQPEQQELLAALAQLLTLHQAQRIEKVEEKPSGYVKEARFETVQQDQTLSGPATDVSVKDKLVGLMHQIAHKVQELGLATTKEFADVPMFMGVEKEYILNKPNKVNEVLTLLALAAGQLEAMKPQEQATASGKLRDKVQELLQLFAGKMEKVDMPVEQQKIELPLLAHKTAIQTAGCAGISTESAEPAAKSVEPAPTIATMQPETAKAAPVANKPEPASAPPVVRMTNLADDLGAILGSSAKFSGTGETAQLKVSIFPEHLGQLEIRLSTIDGKVAAQIFTSNLMAKEALELQVFQLRNSLIQQGIQVDRIEISTHQSLSQQQSQQEQRFARQQRQQPTMKNGYQQNGEETSGSLRGVSSDRSVMAVDYTI
jgi:flagellar hook-length control protein FliK